jgi:hypothetical protein
VYKTPVAFAGYGRFVCGATSSELTRSALILSFAVTMLHLVFRIFYFLMALAGLAGCAVYRPMQCAAPALYNAGQVEVTGSGYFNTRLNGAVNYSPIRHLLVRVAVDGKADSNDSTYTRSRQYELAVGTYWPVGEQVVLGALTGTGQARSQVRYRPIETPFPVQYEYDTRYNKLFGEVYGTWQIGSALQAGVAYRLTHVRFTSLTNLGQPLALSAMLRSEPMVFLRSTFGFRPGGERLAYVQAGIGGSALLRAWPAQTSGPDSNLLDSNTYLTIGVGFFPSMLWRH